MKKALIITLITILLFGCTSMKPKDKVEKYLNNYITLSDDVLSQVDTSVELENLSSKNKMIYKDVLKRQYKNLKYEIKDEEIDGNNASVKVNITVYDLYASSKRSNDYLIDHEDDFYGEDNVFKTDVYDEYRLNEMLKVNDTVDYTLTFNLVKEDDTWVVKEPSREVLEKIHGLYNYDKE